MNPVVEDSHLDVFCLLADAVVHEIPPSEIVEYLHPDFPKDKVEEYLAEFSHPSAIPEFREVAKRIINKGTVLSIKLFLLLATALDSRILAPALTNSTTLIRDMDLSQREELLRSWRDSPFTTKRKLFRVYNSFTLNAFSKTATDLHFKALGYPGRELRTQIQDYEVDPFRYTFLEKPQQDGQELHFPDIDVLIIGSGSGAGVVAQTLSENGLKSLVLEKGKYFSNDELTMNDLEGSEALFENGGALSSTNQQIFIIAGSTFGGGSTVNWSACLKTPFKVRKEWYDNFGLDFVATQYYEDCMDYVWKKMGASNENIDHSGANSVILEGSKKLGYPHRAVEQNNGGKIHDCGMCHLGCRFGIKQGSVNCWFRGPSENGSKFMQQVLVDKILQRDGKAVGVLCRDVVTGVKFKITGPKKIVVFWWFFANSGFVTKSGFKNKHIGANLKLHPVSLTLGDFGNNVDFEAYRKPIMTSICNKVEDLDGKAHGTRIEAMLNAPYGVAPFFPWKSGAESRKDLLRYKQTVPILLLSRDTTSGSVTYDKQKPDALVIDYLLNKFDRNSILQGFLIASDLLYIEGASRDHVTYKLGYQWFKSSKPKHARSIEDEDYVNWRAKVAKIPFDSYGSPYGSAHQMSTCRMSGKGPGYGACDTKGKLFECSNVYVADASTLPTASGANPMVSTMSFARHVSLGIVKELQQSKL
uniref:Long-chain-alcohol oxidase n=1 Tax=[Candida] cloacae TaxID=94006 RepID=Q9P8D7_9ASCO|nr:long chain fatty alcohol oxidase [[Candida] cloacae]